MVLTLGKTFVPSERRTDEELEKSISSVKIGFARMVYVAEHAPDLALNLFAIYDLLVELKWMRMQLEEARRQREWDVEGPV